MSKGAFLLAVFAALGWFAKEAWPYLKAYLNERQTRQRVEQLRSERERRRAADEQ